tara:strand:+ start:383 stop:1114 length:732 start_codon:yes stop_codon:yes gene_type:complete
MGKINLYEFIGIMIGDGCLLYYPKHRIYGIEITGNHIEEKDYYEKIKSFVQSHFSLNPRVYVKHSKLGKCLKLVVYSKHFAETLMTYGITKNKTFTTRIPNEFLEWEKSKFIIKGIFETDGCLYFSKSKVMEYPSYPRLEIDTSSSELAEQILTLLNENGFAARSYKNRKTIVIYMSGENVLNKWVEEIGFSSYKNWSKYLLWKKLGYYIPRLSLPERDTLLRAGGQEAKIGKANSKRIPAED